MRTYHLIIIFILILFNSCKEEKDKNKIKSSNENFKEFQLGKTYKINEDDSIKKEELLKLSYKYMRAQDSINFFSINKEARELSKKLRDTNAIAASYWDLGQYYYKKDTRDSAYYYFNEAKKNYSKIGEHRNTARLLLNMAIMQKDLKDYTGSEVALTEAIQLLKPLKNDKQLYLAYNNLGILFKELEELDRSLYYYNKALSYLEKAQIKSKFPSLWNNIGNVYLDKKDYKTAISYFNKGLHIDDSLKLKDPKIYSMLIDNRAFAQWHTADTSGVLDGYKTAFSIRKENDIKAGITISQMRMAKYYLAKKDSATALSYAKDALDLSIKIQANENYLSSLKLLSEIDTENALSYTQTYIQLNDSLQKEERAVRNKFARIRFETDEYISETKKLNQQIIKISIIAAIIIIIAILIYIIKDQRSKNKLIQQKQKANQEIYNLILEQQKYYEEGREREKLHLSRELHDGVLGKLFGLRLSLDILNEDDSRESKDNRKKYINEIATVAKEIRDISHKLSESNFVEVNFKVVLEELINQQKVYRFNVDFHIDEKINWDNINNNIKINIYRILQEAFTNIYKHAEANNVKISIFQKQLSLHLTIKDDGKGFDLNKSPGIGVKNMKSRSKSIGADFSIASKLNEGTIITVSVKI
ncbi:tetratricopeptide repeat-containing sensor histidine kinase [Zunongwangia pacifica]|uniref:Histidine kinase n=1 Tax=Zunongwangia pacifica TaxID=2911062 RepID=A0A9X1ZPY0_9FLAO|nr:tetratricopeptide repeat-containing sensor histidine kinase [Zunongwangia pacifica]MCL6218817.1 histidine kinase [Zunongwangia pacifica]